MRSAARGSPLARPRSASMTPTRLSIGKWWPLATSCVPMTMSKRPCGDVGELLAHALDRGDEIARQHQHARAGKQLAHLFVQPLDARAAGDERVRRLAFRASRRMRHGEAAVVADELAAEAMIDQPGVAVRAREAEAAGAAQRQRRVAAAIEKQQRLLAALERGLAPRRRARGEMKRPRGGGASRADRSPRSTAGAGRRSAPAAPAAGSGRAAH